MPDALSITQLTKAFPDRFGGTVRVLDVPQFTLREKESVAVRGESGSGKTTFLHCISGIHSVDTGEVLVAGQAMHGLREAARDRLRASTIGYVFQSFNLLQGLDCVENVLVAMRFGRERPNRGRAEQLLRRVGLGERLGYRPRELSVGQLQRVAVARALANRPGLVLADEPTGNLDKRNADAVLQLIVEVCKEEGSALLLVSHDEGVLARFGQVVDFSQINQVEEVR